MTVGRGAAWTLAAWAGLALLGCGGGGEPAGGGGPAQEAGPSRPRVIPSAKVGRIVLITNGNSDWWSAVETGMKDGASKFSADVEMKRNLEGAGTEGQIRLLEEALGTSEVQAVAVSAVDADAPGIADTMMRLRDVGKVVITIDSDVAPSAIMSRRFYIGTDNARAGEVAGKAAATLRPQGGPVAVFVGTASAANARARLDGFFAGAGPKFTPGERPDLRGPARPQPGPVAPRDRHLQASRDRRDARPLFLQRAPGSPPRSPSSPSSARRRPSSPSTSTSRPSTSWRRGPSTSRSARIPTRSAIQAVKPPLRPDEGGPGDRRGHVPQGGQGEPSIPASG